LAAVLFALVLFAEVASDLALESELVVESDLAAESDVESVDEVPLVDVLLSPEEDPESLPAAGLRA